MYRVFTFATVIGAALGVCAQTPLDPEEVLARARDRILDRTERLPNYICVQTVDRQYFKRKNPEYPIPSCDKMSGQKTRNAYTLQLEATDRLRLDVKVSGGSEIGAWAGSSHFDDGDIRKLVRGPFGTGGFGTFLTDIFTGPSVPFNFQGEEVVDGVKLFLYRFQMSRESSHYLVGQGGNWTYTAYDGKLWIDPSTFDLRRLMVRTGELPEETNTCESTTTVDYARARIGTGDFLLPQHSKLHFLMRDTREDDVGTTYSNCHQFLGEAKLVAEPSAATEQPSAAPREPISIPAGLIVPIKFTQPIDSDTAAAGDVVLATVTKPVRDPGSKKQVIPAGSNVHARLVGMQHWFDRNQRFAFTIQLESVEIGSVATPIYARPARPDDEIVDPKGRLIERSNQFYLIPRGQSRPVAYHVVYTKAKRYVMPRGYEMIFVTVPPPAPE